MGKVIIGAIAFYLGYQWGQKTPEQRQAFFANLQAKLPTSLPALPTVTPQTAQMNEVPQGQLVYGR